MITFSYGGCNYQLRNPELMNTMSIKRKLLEGRSASGMLYLYSKGIKIYRMRLTWSELTEQEKMAIESAFDAIDANEFVYTDHKGIDWTALIVSDTLDFNEIHDEPFAGIRHNTRYSVSLEIEVTAI
jgi:hypothetical protein